VPLGADLIAYAGRFVSSIKSDVLDKLVALKSSTNPSRQCESIAERATSGVRSKRNRGFVAPRAVTRSVGQERHF